jgi:hypothetical protein
MEEQGVAQQIAKMTSKTVPRAFLFLLFPGPNGNTIEVIIPVDPGQRPRSLIRAIMRRWAG